MSPVAGCACLCCCSCTGQTDVLSSVTSLAGGAGWRSLVCLGPTLGFQPCMLILLFVSSRVSSRRVAARYLSVLIVHVPQLLEVFLLMLLWLVIIRGGLAAACRRIVFTVQCSCQIDMHDHLSSCVAFQEPTLSALLSLDTPREKATRLHNSFVCPMSPVAGCACLCCCSCTGQTDVLSSVTSLAGGAGWRSLVCLGPTLGFQPCMLILLFVSSRVSSRRVAARYLSVFVVHVPQLLNAASAHTHAHIHTHTHTHTDRATHTHTRIHTHSPTHPPTQTQTHTHTPTHKHTHTPTHKHAHTHRQTETDRDRQRQTEKTDRQTQPSAFAKHQSQTIAFHDGLRRHVWPHCRWRRAPHAARPLSVSGYTTHTTHTTHTLLTYIHNHTYIHT